MNKEQRAKKKKEIVTEFRRLRKVEGYTKTLKYLSYKHNLHTQTIKNYIKHERDNNNKSGNNI